MKNKARFFSYFIFYILINKKMRKEKIVKNEKEITAARARNKNGANVSSPSSGILRAVFGANWKTMHGTTKVLYFPFPPLLLSLPLPYPLFLPANKKYFFSFF
jgi:hypothetical protein